MRCVSAQTSVFGLCLNWVVGMLCLALYLADLTSDLVHHHGLLWQFGLLALVTITASALLVWVLWDCALAGDVLPHCHPWLLACLPLKSSPT